jgi:hypothetical protein
MSSTSTDLAAEPTGLRKMLADYLLHLLGAGLLGIVAHAVYLWVDVHDLQLEVAQARVDVAAARQVADQNASAITELRVSLLAAKDSAADTKMAVATLQSSILELARRP